MHIDCRLIFGLRASNQPPSAGNNVRRSNLDWRERIPGLTTTGMKANALRES